MSRSTAADLIDTVADAVAERVASRVADLLRDAAQPRQVKEPRFLGEKVLAERLALSVKTLQGWRSTGSGPPYVKAGRRVLYEAAAVERWLADQAGNGSAPAASTSARANRGRASARAVHREA